MGWLSDETGLEKTPANFVPLTPLSHLARAADIHADRTALVWKGTRRSYGEYARGSAVWPRGWRGAGCGRGMWWRHFCPISRNRPRRISACPPAGPC